MSILKFNYQKIVIPGLAVVVLETVAVELVEGVEGRIVVIILVVVCEEVVEIDGTFFLIKNVCLIRFKNKNIIVA